MKPFLLNIRHLLEYWLVLLLFEIAHFMPRVVFHKFAPVAGWVGLRLPGFGDIAVMNLKAAFPEKGEAEIKDIARRSFAHIFMVICEFFWLKGKVGEFNKIVHPDPECYSTSELARKSGSKGMIFVTPHVGNWEISGMVLALQLDFKVGTVVRTARNPYLDRLISSGRMVEGVRIIHSKGAVREMLHAIEDGYAIGTLIDQNTRVRDGGIFVNFFGLPVPVSRAPAALARKSNYFVATGATFRTGMEFIPYFKPLPKPVAEYGSDEELTQDLMTMAEDFIRRDPAQYIWFYKRFQYIPKEAPEEIRKRFPAYAKLADERFYSKPAARKNPLK